MEHLIDTLRDAFCGARILSYVERITQHHRIQASPGFHAAADELYHLLRDHGVPAEILSFPADYDVNFWGHPSFDEWHIEHASLQLVSPKKCKLSDFDAIPISVVQRSPSCAGEFDVVHVEAADNPNSYQITDVRGKFILTDKKVASVYKACIDHHPAGILYYGMRDLPTVREKGSLPNAHEYASFWWKKGDTPLPGFVLTPKQGAQLKQYLQDGTPVKVRAEIKTSFRPGKLELLSAKIPGKSDNEVLLIAHLCHPQPSANDNASGSAVLLEVAIQLTKLITTGLLPSPEHTIRLLWVPELYGTLAYLSHNEHIIPKLLCGVNLDMVGENQPLCGSSYRVIETPLVTAGFINPLAELMLNEFYPMLPDYTGLPGCYMDRFQMVSFRGGSDHEILSHPTVGVPVIMLNQWPDRFYHTSFDTVLNVDPNILQVTALFTANLAYGIANIKQLNLDLKTLTRIYYERKLLKLIQYQAYKKTDLIITKALDILKSAGLTALDGLNKLGIQPTDAMNRFVNFVESLKKDYTTRKLTNDEQEASKLVPVPLYRRPPYIDTYRLPYDKRQRLHKLEKIHNALLWVDGTRSVLDIHTGMRVEHGESNLPDLMEFFTLMEELGIVKFK